MGEFYKSSRLLGFLDYTGIKRRWPWKGTVLPFTNFMYSSSTWSGKVYRISCIRGLRQLRSYLPYSSGRTTGLWSLLTIKLVHSQKWSHSFCYTGLYETTSWSSLPRLSGLVKEWKKMLYMHFAIGNYCADLPEQKDRLCVEYSNTTNQSCPRFHICRHDMGLYNIWKGDDEMLRTETEEPVGSLKCKAGLINYPIRSFYTSNANVSIRISFCMIITCAWHICNIYGWAIAYVSSWDFENDQTMSMW